MPVVEPKVYSVAEWGGRVIDNRALSLLPAQGIVVHHTAGHNRKWFEDDAHEFKVASATARGIQKLHMSGGRGKPWRDSGQHFTVPRGGLILEGRTGSLAAAKRGLVLRGAHASVEVANSRWWGIEVEGLYTDEEPPEVQVQGLIALCAWLSWVGRTQSHEIQGHRLFKKTLCPGDVLFHMLPELRLQVRARKLAFMGP
jgi:N-acetylmuramoyl-L-alanine amidase